MMTTTSHAEPQPTRSTSAVAQSSERISWGEYFMGAAILAAKRSNDPMTKVGAVLVDEKRRIISVGWNGMPIGCRDEDMPWGKDPKNFLADKLSFVCHAESNAFQCSTKVDIESASLYTTLFPCLGCAKKIGQFQVKTVYYLSDKKKDKEEFKRSRKLLENEGVSLIDFREFHKSKKRQGKVGYSRPPKDMMLDFDYKEKDSLSQAKKPREEDKEWVAPTNNMEWAFESKTKKNKQDGAALVNEKGDVVGLGWIEQSTVKIYKAKDRTAWLNASGSTSNADEWKNPYPKDYKLYITSFPKKNVAEELVKTKVAELCYPSESAVDDEAKKILGEHDVKLKCGRVKWEDYFMGLAILLSRRSSETMKDGAVLVDKEKKIVGVGWSGQPTGVEEEGDEYALPAAANAITFKTTPDIGGCQLYTTDYPCNVSAQLIAQSGVTEVHYLSDWNLKHSENSDVRKRYEAAELIFKHKKNPGVKLYKFQKSLERKDYPRIKVSFSYLDD